MGIISRLLAPRPVAYAPDSDFWFSSLGAPSLTGIRVDADSALKASAVWACVRLISESIASLPLILYRRMPNDERERATDNYLYSVLRTRPNANQTPFEFKQMMTAHTLLRGNAYARITPGRRGFADQLVPLHPDRVNPEWFDGSRWRDDSSASSSWAPEAGAPVRYVYRQASGQDIAYSDDEIFHMRGLWTHGIRGLSVIAYARESIGLAQATEQYGSRVFSQGANLGGVLTHPGKLSDEGAKKLKKRWEESQSGLSNAHRTAVLEEGMKWEKISMTNEDAQFLLTRSFQVEDIARWFNVPLHMIQHSEKSTSWGTGIEQITLGFIKFTLRSWAARWEDSISRDLINSTDTYYAEFNFNDLERGDIKTRYEAYQIGRMGGWLSANDVLRKENMNPIDGHAGNVYWRPANMVDANDPTPALLPEPSPEPPRNRANGHYMHLLHDAALRVIRKETTALPKLAKRHCDDADAWQCSVEEFYGEHVDYVMQSMGIIRGKAEAYCSEQRAMVLQGGAGALEDWGNERIPALIELAIGGNDA